MISVSGVMKSVEYDEAHSMDKATIFQREIKTCYVACGLFTVVPMLT